MILRKLRRRDIARIFLIGIGAKLVLVAVAILFFADVRHAL
jgi:hypothetical protein